MNIKKEDFPKLKIKADIELDSLPGFKWVAGDRECGFCYVRGNLYVCSNVRRLEFDKLTKKDLAVLIELCCNGYITPINF